MLTFDPNDPYPLLEPESHTYAEAQGHSAQVDAWLGIDPSRVERELKGAERQQLWIGLPVAAMMTPYAEIREILFRLAPQPGQTIIDLGAGYGRMGFVVATHYPLLKFIGYEFVPERVAEGNRGLLARNHRPPQIRLEEKDLLDPTFQPETAEYYFLYDYGTREAIQKTLEDLRELSRTRALTVIGRGRAARDAIEREHPLLSQVVAPLHFKHYSIYCSA
jgi:hypothetical protein